MWHFVAILMIIDSQTHKSILWYKLSEIQKYFA